MGGIIGANNKFGMDFNHPDADMQGNITALYDSKFIRKLLLEKGASPTLPKLFERIEFRLADTDSQILWLAA